MKNRISIALLSWLLLVAWGLGEEPVLASSNPVQFFRQLLQASAEERAALLAEKTETSRARIQRGLIEFESLRPEARERRLELLEFRFYLLRSLERKDESLESKLAATPDRFRTVIRTRMEHWMLYPPQLQDQLLAYNKNLARLEALRNSNDKQRKAILSSVSELERTRLEKDFQGWVDLPESKREAVRRQIGAFFSIPKQDRLQAIKSLDADEQRQLTSIVRLLDGQTAEVRDRLIDGFLEFVQLSAIEKGEFVQGARRWRKMSDSEKAGWRALITKVESQGQTIPPLPPLKGLLVPPVPALSASPAASH